MPTESGPETWFRHFQESEMTFRMKRGNAGKG